MRLFLKKRPIPHKHGIPSDSQSSGGIPFVKIVDLSRRRQSEASDSGACHATPMRSFFLYWLGERPVSPLKDLGEIIVVLKAGLAGYRGHALILREHLFFAALMRVLRMYWRCLYPYMYS